MLLLSTSAQFLLYFCIFDNLSPLPRRFYNEKENKNLLTISSKSTILHCNQSSNVQFNSFMPCIVHFILLQRQRQRQQHYNQRTFNTLTFHLNYGYRSRLVIVIGIGIVMAMAYSCGYNFRRFFDFIYRVEFFFIVHNLYKVNWIERNSTEPNRTQTERNRIELNEEIRFYYRFVCSTVSDK